MLDNRASPFLSQKAIRMIAFVYRLSQWAAIIGGLALVALTLMIVASVSGRAMLNLGLGPVPGDFELVEVGTAIAVFFFLPWTYLKGGHATVDLLYMHLPKWAQKGIVLVSDVVMLIVWLVLTWKLYEGMVEKKEYFETTFILQMPIWWAYAACLVGAVIGCLAYIAKTATMFGLGKEPEGWTTEAGAH
ncbi:MAG: TRAP transporter small permease subunit [Hydrogenophaga sp.]|nr:TRAP transporter small permease subunit [Hydrogenophaga sp.]NIN29012.1 TRAP transporter small permease subunit [Hydrogenophaga sp.]NIN33489.1 TRAP transporter small permease subunit [Hydrogenophaga sp.]NIN58148.1 TRAP transporter small permease subunit [Hydrogenophaga sp.]NIO54446.1 TRAP transporter small permease subunit [Hydrogenophaga sp.]